MIFIRDLARDIFCNDDLTKAWEKEEYESKRKAILDAI